MEDYGKVDLVLDEYIIEHKVSRTSLSRKADVHYGQLLRYLENKMQKVDLNILSRICKTLNCQVGDIIKYTPPKAKEDETK